MAKAIEVKEPGQGIMFENNTENPKAPDYKGAIRTPDGEMWEIAGWSRTAKNGTQFLSLKVSEPYKKPKSSEDEIPF